MEEVYPNLYVGSLRDFELLGDGLEGWHILHAAKDPFHRQFVGYRTRGAPQGAEYFAARRDARLALNLIDPEDSRYVAREALHAGLEFLDEATAAGGKVLIHCNQGRSRAPSLALLWLYSRGRLEPCPILHAWVKFKRTYKPFHPGVGMADFLRKNWWDYCPSPKSVVDQLLARAPLKAPPPPDTAPPSAEPPPAAAEKPKEAAQDTAEAPAAAEAPPPEPEPVPADFKPPEELEEFWTPAMQSAWLRLSERHQTFLLVWFRMGYKTKDAYKEAYGCPEMDDHTARVSGNRVLGRADVHDFRVEVQQYLKPPLEQLYIAEVEALEAEKVIYDAEGKEVGREPHHYVRLAAKKSIDKENIRMSKRQEKLDAAKAEQKGVVNLDVLKNLLNR